MKHGGKVAICLAGGLAWNAGVSILFADSNPYASIVDRNVFNLKPVPVAVPVDPNPPTPPSKITLLGIVADAGKRVIFKTPVGTPPKEKTFTLDEGQLLDSFEALEINVPAGSVRLKNHGVEQTLTLKDDGMKSAGGPPGLPVPGAPGLPGGIRLPPPVPGGPTASAAPAPTGGNMVTFGAGANMPNRPVRGLATTSGAPGMVAAGAGRGQPQNQAHLTPEEQIVLMEVNRELTKKQVADGTLPPLPPTPLTGELQKPAP